ncbi:MAG: ABC transporter substrate-binding protein [Candidatus Omnitrophica bacterium]|nr:ABC transporter substrate-binding protein [Candidatus Omnitrophota bacterium]
MKRIICLITFILFVSGCGQNKPAAEISTGVSDNEIVIGSSAALGGFAGFLGTQTIHGSLAYINEINAGAGIHGRKIRLISTDDHYNPAETVTNTQKLIAQVGVFALFDYVGTPTTAQVVDIVHKAEIPLLGIFSGAEIFRTPYRPYIFNVRDSYYAEAESAISYFVDKMNLKKIAVLYQEDTFGVSVLSGVQLALERRGMRTVATETFARGAMNVEQAMLNIKLSEADVVIMVGTYSPLAKFVKISNDAGFRPYFHTVSFVGSEAFAKELIQIQKIKPSDYSKIIVTQVVPDPFLEELSGVREYRELVKKYFPNDEPNYVALEGFINAKVLVKALEIAGVDLTREKFIEALESMHNVDIGIGKEITYSVLGHQGLKGVYYSKLSEDGKFRVFNQVNVVLGYKDETNP